MNSKTNLLLPKKACAFIACLILAFGLHAQSFDAIDSKVSNYRGATVRSPDKLAEQINADFSSDLDKARAIYTWMAKNIAYDVEEYRKGVKPFRYTYRTQEEKEFKQQQHKIKIAEQTFKKRKAVCNGYANLYKNLCDKTGLKCEIISGYSKTKVRDIGREPAKSTHAWNAVFIDNNWHLLDATWGAGHVDGNKFYAEFDPVYFMTSPDKFHLNHYPEDVKWLQTKLPKKKYVEAPLYYSTFLDLDIEIEAPKKGIINVKPEGEITIKIQSTEDPKGYSYSFSRERYSTPLKFESKGKVYEAKIVVPRTKSAYLYLYHRNTGIVVYKLRY